MNFPLIQTRLWKILLCGVIGGGMLSGAFLGLNGSALAIVNFATFQLTQSTITDDSRKNKDVVEITGTFSLSPTGLGINPLTESVSVNIKGSGDTTIFSQTIPAGSFKQEKEKGQPVPGAFAFKGKGPGGLKSVTITQTPSGSYDFSLEGSQLEFACCLSAKVLMLIIGDDGGAFDLENNQQIPIDLGPQISGLIPAQLLIPLGEQEILTVQVDNPDLIQNMVVTLTSADPNIASVPADITLAPGATSGEVPVTGVAEGGPIAITAMLNGTSAMSEVTVVMRPPPPVIAEPLTEGATMVGGTGVPGALIDVEVDGQPAGMGIVEANGQFGVSVPALVAGAVVQAVQTLNGLASDPSASVTVLPIPPAPMLTPPLVEGMTTVMGTGVSDANVEIFIDTVFAAEGLVQMDGTFTVTLPPLVAGQEVTATQTVADVTSNPSQPITVVQTPAPPVITTPVVAGSPSVAGTGLEGATVEVFLDSTSAGTGLVNAMGMWSVAMGSPLVAGQEVQANQTINDVPSALSDPVTVIAPSPPPTVNTPLVAGSTDISGTGTNGATVDVFVDSTNVGATTVGAAGEWNLMVSQPLSAGQVVQATQTVADITSDLSNPVTVQSPTPPPTVDTPLIAGSTTVSGTGAMGATVEVFVDNVSGGMTTVGSADTWMLTLAQSLTPGQVVEATQTVGGITSDRSDSVTVIQPPPPPTVTGPLFAGNQTVDGTGLPNASLEVFVDGQSGGSTAVDINGNWMLDLTQPLQTDEQVTAVQTVAGIDSLPSVPVIVGAAILEQIEITPASTASIEVGQTQQFTAAGTFTDGTVEDPLSGVQWNSDNDTIASIDATGLATGNTSGMAQIHASRDGIDSPETTLTVTQTGPTLTDFTPKSASIGESITITGTTLTPATPGALSVTLAQQGGGRIDAPVTTSNDTTIIFTVPTGADTGDLEVSIDQQPVQVPPPPTLTIVASSDYSLSVEPATADLIQGQSISYKIALASNTGFTQLAALSVSGLPGGVTASFKPQQISAGQTALLTVNGPAGQPLGTEALSITAAATVDGIDLEETGNATFTIQPVTTTFLGRTVVTDSVLTPLTGVTVTLIGQDGSGNATGCSGQTVSDAAGNFALTNLSSDCVGGQLVRFDGSTATFPAGTYAGVDKFYTLTLDQVTKPPVLVHLPRIDNADTIMVQQNAPADQTFTFPNIPNLAITVYAGTIFTLENGSQPNPFPLVAVEIPLDRLPGGNVPPSNDNVVPFLVGFQPANTSVNQPAAVFFPNTLNNDPGTSVPLLTLDPTKGIMVNYGTGTISANGTQVIPDLDPATPGKRYGLTHLGWHGPTPVPPGPTPCMTCPCPTGGNPVDAGSGVKVINNTDIAINGQRGSIALNRTMRTMSAQAGPFGLGTNHNFGHRLNNRTPFGAAVITLIMPDGNAIPFTANADGTLTNATVPSMRGVVMTVASTQETDLRFKDGTVFHFIPTTFALGSLIESITDANGNRIALVRNPSRPAQITEVIDPVGRKLVLSYDGADRILSVADPIGRTVGYAYNAQGRLDTVTDTEGGLTRYDYDSQGRLTQGTDARGVIIAQNTFDSNGRIIEQQLADGGIYTFSYELLNPLIANSSVQVSTVTDPLGNTTTYRFNPQGNLLDATDHLGQVREYEREPGTNQLLATTGAGSCPVCGDVGGGDVSFTYDANGNVLTRTDALGHTTQFEYDPVFNKVTSITDPLGHKETRTYDNAGNLLSTTDENGNTTSSQYNQFGQVIQITDPLNHIITFDYDGFGNLIAITVPLGHITRTQYDGISRNVEAFDALGRSTKTTYDKLSRVLTVTDAKGNMTQMDYDEVGNRLRVTDARGNPISFTYDGLNRLKTRIDSRGNVDTRTYDLAGNMTEFIDRRGQTSSFTYDELNRAVTETYQDGSLVQRTYDALGRLKQVDDTAGGTFKFEYDLRGQLLKAVGPFGTVQYSRDELGRVTQRQVVGQPPATYTFDPAGNLLSSTMPQAGVTNSYDARNQLLHQVRTNGVTTDYNYDSAGRLLTLTHANGAQVLEAQTYTYDAVGNRISKTSTNAQALTTQSSVRQYATDSNLLLQQDSISYTHDLNGNRLTENDPNGTTTYTWDVRNRLELIQGPGGMNSFRYDFGGNLTSLVRGSQSDQMVLDEITNVVFQKSSDGNQFSVLTSQTIDQHLGIVRINGQVEYGLTDAINSTVLTSDEGGIAVGAFNYEAFGETTSNGTAYPFRFTGRVPIASDLYHYRARYLDPLSGRFISEDPIGLENGINSFTYVGNNPILNTDPLGLRENTTSASKTCSNNGSDDNSCATGPFDQGPDCRKFAREENDCANSCCTDNCAKVDEDYKACCQRIPNPILELICRYSTCGDPRTLCE